MTGAAAPSGRGEKAVNGRCDQHRVFLFQKQGACSGRADKAGRDGRTGHNSGYYIPRRILSARPPVVASTANSTVLEFCPLLSVLSGPSQFKGLGKEPDEIGVGILSGAVLAYREQNVFLPDKTILSGGVQVC